MRHANNLPRVNFDSVYRRSVRLRFPFLQRETKIAGLNRENFVSSGIFQEVRSGFKSEKQKATLNNFFFETCARIYLILFSSYNEYDRLSSSFKFNFCSEIIRESNTHILIIICS